MSQAIPDAIFNCGADAQRLRDLRPARQPDEY
jgi:hypothetical protein